MIVLLSGGLDSIAAWRLLGLPQAINFDLSTKAAGREAEALSWASRHFGASYIQAALPMAHAEGGNAYVEFRNSILILLAAQHDPHVVLGAVAEYGPDKNRRFYRRLERAVNARGAAANNAAGLKVLTPYDTLSKGELIAAYCQRFGVIEAEQLLDNTWSCYLDGRSPCLMCGGCRQRIAAEHQYARICGGEAPLYTARRWSIPLVDRFRWVLANGVVGVRQIRAHTRQDNCLPVL